MSRCVCRVDWAGEGTASASRGGHNRGGSVEINSLMVRDFDKTRKTTLSDDALFHLSPPPTLSRTRQQGLGSDADRLKWCVLSFSLSLSTKTEVETKKQHERKRAEKARSFFLLDPERAFFDFLRPPLTLFLRNPKNPTTKNLFFTY